MTGGLRSSAYNKDFPIESVPVSLNSKILTNDIAVTTNMLGGDSGLFRFWWSFTTGADYQVTITKKGQADLTGFPLIVNGDNDFVIKSDGYYRFDVSVKPGDLVNFSSNVEISKINELQIQQIQIGA